MTVRTWLEDLSPADCVQFLAGSIVGRVGVFVDGRPEIFPVNHVYDERTDTVLFPSNAGTKLWGALHWPWVSFEVDGIDVDGRSGWSVLVVGRAEHVTDDDDIRRAMSRRRVLWAVGPSTHWVRIVPTRVTGRRIRAISSV